MSDVKFTVCGTMEDEASRSFIDARHRAERGERFYERLLAFESWEALARVLTGKRMELLRSVRRNNVPSVRALAKALSRDYSNVHADVKALAGAGLLETLAMGSAPITTPLKPESRSEIANVLFDLVMIE
jgi:predicted transcriptional regulator